MTPSQTFLPKDRDGALQEVKRMLHAQLDLLAPVIDDLEGYDQGDGFVVGKLIAYKNQHMFIKNLLDIIERS